MSRHWKYLVLAAVVVSAVAFSSMAWAAGGPPATKLVNVADTRTLSPGLGLWLARVYNESFTYFGLLTVACMVFQGLALGLISDRAIVALGLNLGKLDHKE